MRNEKLKNKNNYGPISRKKAIKMMEISYLGASTALIWIALYYLPIGGALFRVALPLPLILLQLRRGNSAGLEGSLLTVLLLSALMGPIRGPLFLFPYGLLALWLGWSWNEGINWWKSWLFGALLGTFGFLLRVLVLSFLVGENLWVLITRAGSGLLEKIVASLNISFIPDIIHVQLMAVSLVVIQELIYVLVIHALAFWIFPRLKAPIPDPPTLLNGLVALDPL